MLLRWCVAVVLVVPSIARADDTVEVDAGLGTLVVVGAPGGGGFGLAAGVSAGSFVGANDAILFRVTGIRRSTIDTTDLFLFVGPSLQHWSGRKAWGEVGVGGIAVNIGHPGAESHTYVRAALELRGGIALESGPRHAIGLSLVATVVVAEERGGTVAVVIGYQRLPAPAPQMP